MSPIRGLTDNVQPRFPMLGKLRKGGEKQANGQYGKDLPYWRFTSDVPEIAAAFAKEVGEKPTKVLVYLPYSTVDENFSTWKEAWVAGGLVHRCDGETCTIWRNGDKYSTEPKPCEFKDKPSKDGCKPVGRLMLIIPELIKAGYVGYVTVETHSLHDLMNITASLLATEASRTNNPRGLQGIQFILRRKPEEISVPGFGANVGKRQRMVKWLVSLEPVPSFVEAQLALASRSQFVDTTTGEVFEQPEAPTDEDDEDAVTVEAVVTPEPKATARPAQPPQQPPDEPPLPEWLEGEVVEPPPVVIPPELSSDKQRGMMFGLARKIWGEAKEQYEAPFRALLKDAWNVESTRDLTKVQASSCIDMMQGKLKMMEDDAKAATE